MTKGGRIAIGSLFVLIMTLIAILLFSLQLVRKSLPKINGTIKLQGLRSIVKIYRDNYGIPHIFANNEDDLFYAMGFVTAQDRLWQMDVSRRTAKGILSEIFGKSTVDTDRLFRTIGLYRTAEEITRQLSPESRNMLIQYATGVNTFIITNQDNLPLEFTLLDYKPQLWKIEDSIAYQRLIAWGFALGRHYDLIFGALIEKLGHKKVKEIFPEYLTSDPVIIPYSASKLSQLYDQLHQITNTITEWIPHYSASNCWVVSGEKSKTGKPLLANDPHLKFTLPSMFYEIHLVAPFINVYGVALPGLPGVIIGHNHAIAWGSTNMMADDMDFFIERVDTNQYFYRRKWHKMDLIEELIHIKGQPPETLAVRSTKHGPIISDVLEVLKNSDQAVSMKWTGMEISDELLAYYQIMKAGNWNQFKAGIQHFKVPGQNLLYADTSGNIGYWGVSAVPIRKTGNGEFPRPGWNNKSEWEGYISFDELPHLFNPSQRFIVSANNKVIDEKKYPYFISNYWAPSYRAARIIELLSQRDKCTVADFKQMQFDQYSKHAELYIPLILRTLSDFQLDNDLQFYFYDALRTWDFTAIADKIAPSIFNLFFAYFVKNILKDEMGDTLYNQFIHLPGLAIRATDRLLQKGDSKWFDDINTAQNENLTEIILKSLDDTFNYLIQKHGKLINNWRWGELHDIRLKHPLSKEKSLSMVLNVGHFPMGGDNCTINLGGYLFTDPFTPIIGPLTRQIVDLSNINNSLSVNSTGQSGQPLDEHYKDQINLWLEGDYHPAIMSLEEIENSNFNLLVLKPK